jgi:hypothetical protein
VIHRQTYATTHKFNMNTSRAFLKQFQSSLGRQSTKTKAQTPSFLSRCPQCRHISRTTSKSRQLADDPGFSSIVDNPPQLVRAGRKHGPGLIILGTYASKYNHNFPNYSITKLTCTLASNNTNNSIRTWDMASPTTLLENRSHSEIRRPSNTRPFTAST